MFVVIDTETTGLENGKVVEIAGVWVEGGMIVSSYQTLCNPGIPIPPEASAVHHLVDDDVKDAPKFEAVKHKFFADVFVAHNAAYDAGVCKFGGAQWICTRKCAMVVWPDAPSHSNQVLRYWLKLDVPAAALEIMPHRALHDALVTTALFNRLSSELSVSDMLDISGKPCLLSKVGFGKHAGTKWSDVPLDYLRWCAKQDMDEDVLYTVGFHIARMAKC